MQVRFWGVRGSIAVSGSQYVATGGNTPCVEVTHEDHRIILDGGTGLRGLGESLGYAPVRATLLFSHVHWDHIQGVPFFAPAWHPDAELTLRGASRDSGSLRDALAAQMQPPRFPVTLEQLTAKLHFEAVTPGTAWEVGPFRVLPAELEHPDGVLAYRIEAGGRSMVYATDVEHAHGLDARLLELAEGADLLIHDAQYQVDEYEGRRGPSRRGWGHSTWNDAVEIGRRASVGGLALFHHDPMRADAEVDAIETAARDLFARAFSARERALVQL
jgi:phosphoribosyl 1,2-cyclic phosphodiesterase